MVKFEIALDDDVSFPRTRREFRSLKEFDWNLQESQTTVKEDMTKHINAAAMIAVSLPSRTSLQHVVSRIRSVAAQAKMKETAVYLIDSILRRAWKTDKEALGWRYQRHLEVHLRHVFKRALRREKSKTYLAERFMSKILLKWKERGWFANSIAALVDIVHRAAPSLVRPVPLLSENMAEESLSEASSPHEEEGPVVEEATGMWTPGAPAAGAPGTPMQPALFLGSRGLMAELGGTADVLMSSPRTPTAHPLATYPRTPVAQPLAMFPRTPSLPPMGGFPRTPSGPPLVGFPRTPSLPPMGGFPRTPSGPPLAGFPRTPSGAPLTNFPRTPLPPPAGFRGATAAALNAVPATPRAASMVPSTPRQPAFFHPSATVPSTPVAGSLPQTPRPAAALPYAPFTPRACFPPGVVQPFSPGNLTPSAPQPYTPRQMPLSTSGAGPFSLGVVAPFQPFSPGALTPHQPGGGPMTPVGPIGGDHFWQAGEPGPAAKPFTPAQYGEHGVPSTPMGLVPSAFPGPAHPSIAGSQVPSTPVGALPLPGGTAPVAQPFTPLIQPQTIGSRLETVTEASDSLAPVGPDDQELLAEGGASIVGKAFEGSSSPRGEGLDLEAGAAPRGSSEAAASVADPHAVVPPSTPWLPSGDRVVASTEVAHVDTKIDPVPGPMGLVGAAGPGTPGYVAVAGGHLPPTTPALPGQQGVSPGFRTAPVTPGISSDLLGRGLPGGFKGAAPLTPGSASGPPGTPGFMPVPGGSAPPMTPASLPGPSRDSPLTPNVSGLRAGPSELESEPPAKQARIVAKEEEDSGEETSPPL